MHDDFTDFVQNDLIGYCGNNEEHYGRLCECGCCYKCCTCPRAEDRKAQRAGVKRD